MRHFVRDIDRHRSFILQQKVMFMDKHNKPAKYEGGEALQSIVLIGNYMPRRCGIATFTTHLLEAIEPNVPNTNCWAVAMNDQLDGYNYPSQVRLEINQDKIRDYNLSACLLNIEKVDVVCVQHEYGIFGGQRGSFILTLLNNLKMPIVTTLHTILKDPTDKERHIIVQLAELSDRLVVMSERSVKFLREIYHIDKAKIVLIHHGIPDVPLIETANYKDKFGFADKKVLLTFGLLSPGKGIETVIDALPEVIKHHPNVIYMIVGATHPHLKAEQGEEYRIGLQQRAKKLGVDEHVVFHDLFVSEEDLLEFIGAADVYITPYPNEAQIISGTLAYALGMGKAVVSTPYWHAQELLAEGRGRLFPFQDQRQLADEVIDLLDHPDELHSIQQKAYQYSRQMIWNRVANQYIETFEQSRQHRLRKRIPKEIMQPYGFSQQELPEIKFDHMLNMTDGVGMFQHAKYTVPDRHHGYCVDDNARALIIATIAQDFQPHNTAMNALTSVYLSFIDHAFNHEIGRFRNFMSYDRCWMEEKGSEDSHGRALWGLGTVIALSCNEGVVKHAMELFAHALPVTEHFTSPRAVAFSIIGLNALLFETPENKEFETMFSKLSKKLIQWFRNSASKDWPWCESILTYDNARLPQALMLSGKYLGDDEMLQTGLETLEWLKKIQFDESGYYFSAIGNNGWFSQDNIKTQFDQQPIEAAAMVDACIEAFNITQDEEWLRDAHRCLNWYLGENELHISLYDHASGGCKDGLQEQSANENQGAESTLSWLMALLAIYNQHCHILRPVNKKEIALEMTTGVD